MASKALFSFFLIFSSFLHLGFSDTDIEQLLTGLGQFSAVKEVECMQKLLPCQPALKSPNNPPPACCAPLNEMITNESECICAAFNNLQVLQTYNISKDDILRLPNACGAAFDVSKCNADASAPSTGTDDIETADNSIPDTEDSASSTKMITPNGIIHFGVPGFVALLTAQSALVFSSY